MYDKQPLPRVQDVMTRDVISIAPDLTVRQAKDLMRDKGISGMPVVDRENALLGVISVADIIQAMENNNLNAFVSEVMTVNPIFLHEQDTVGYALQACRRYKYGRFPVIDEQAKVVGVLTVGDIVTRLAQLLRIDQVDEPDEIKEPKDFTTRIYECSIQSMNFDLAGLAASNIKKMLTGLGLKGTTVRRAAIAAYDAEMNVVIHAYEGKLSAKVTPHDITITVEDSGPGIKDVSLAMQPGYSTASDRIREMGFGAGMGLPNIKKSADEFTIESTPKGTTLVIKIFID
ncbi:CBS domain-containing protein [Pelotomaculum terephthalicicum JT]|uniref:CBS domain-containing protein n=1 Tax=Pelotomaculum TaxID=191373 RepID=UPI0009CF07CA|nr:MULTISPECIES: CBS domain-containing protein [Pelotomaculum]MCG9967116.1 CBS domain-containing protein [Pelotomaculum terephthalicicum JT]OPX87786.1 MAG: Inosine-5'-monophosphate dehydrogenase [Pelotomaculum sp. PtaB.Bin117]OPY60472.1 MAG: Inosine-5'-monophosphate dehydrogenase [Pelotomaculum sp. PtaU1.Bin065]